MNEYVEIKELLDRYYEGETTDADEQRLREYFTSDNVAAGLQPYRSLFAYIQHEKEEFQVSGLPSASPSGFKFQVSDFKFQVSRWWYAAAAAVACLLFATFLARENQPAPQIACAGTYVMVNGVCYDDLALVRKYAAEAIDQITQPFGNGSAADALDFLE